ncbi:MaoC family dehydratase [Catenuloplanes atrovinosus]|uniref:Acyl dehydratase n=1 Tax=Catenuloplanes atrovinosus TaxID=137266 RepID=A0AAE3YND4_9ACTN|nr:MaoC family dehydratase [Catenuloplanes atrovinosus]MDR7275695.1 acyl dehydratase [Catenuloplanes atrovinosus]
MTATVRGLGELAATTGLDLGHSDWIEVPQERIDTFADATGDHQWIHVDPARAAAGPFGGTIAHGYLTLALVIPLWTSLLSIEGAGMAVNYGLNRVRFPSPVPAGSKVRLHASVLHAREVAGGGVELTVAMTVQREGATKPAVVAEAVYRYYPG